MQLKSHNSFERKVKTLVSMGWLVSLLEAYITDSSFMHMLNSIISFFLIFGDSSFFLQKIFFYHKFKSYSVVNLILY